MTWHVASCGPCTGDPRPTCTDDDVLLDTSAALIASIPVKLHDASGVHARSSNVVYLGGNTLKTDESIHPNDVNALMPASG